MSKPETGFHQFPINGKYKQLRHMDNGELMDVIEWLWADRESKKATIDDLFGDLRKAQKSNKSIFEMVFGK